MAVRLPKVNDLATLHQHITTAHPTLRSLGDRLKLAME
jgi:hypothetical protein